MFVLWDDSVAAMHVALKTVRMADHRQVIGLFRRTPVNFIQLVCTVIFHTLPKLKLSDMYLTVGV